MIELRVNEKERLLAEEKRCKRNPKRERKNIEINNYETKKERKKEQRK